MKRYTIAVLTIFTSLCLLVFAGCGGGGGENENGNGGEDNSDVPNYLCFTANTANCQLSMYVEKNSYPYDEFTPPQLEYSTDGKKWKIFIPTETWICLEKSGDKVYFRGNNTTFSSDDEYYRYVTNGSFMVSGNIMSLLDKSLKLKTIPSDYCFKMLFDGCDITSAPELPAAILTKYCYFGMFGNCSNLLEAPALPALTLAESCYSCMFVSCTSLIKAPSLPATVLVDLCYNSMFSRCSSLTEAPELPAETMIRYCYMSMFSFCTSLTSAPALPALNLAEGCYLDMFCDCTGLPAAPVLPATVLKDECYRSMFFGCSRLRSITVSFSDWNGATNSTENWVNGVADSGSFRCPGGLADEAGVDRIPTGWTKLDL